MRFRLFGIPVEIQLSFFLIAAVLGWSPQVSPGRVLVWMLVVLASVLIHELGHALIARRIGTDVAITLYALGGLTAWIPKPNRTTPGRRAVVSAAGPAVEIAAGFLVLFLLRSGALPDSRALDLFALISIFWGVFNLAPIRPLDGGHLLASLLEVVAPRRSEVIGSYVFLVTSAAAVVLAVRYDYLFAAILAGFTLFDEFRRIAARRNPPAPAPVEPRPELAPELNPEVAPEENPG